MTTEQIEQALKILKAMQANNKGLKSGILLDIRA